MLFLGQEMLNQDADSKDAPQNRGVCRGKRNRTPREMFVPALHGKTYTKGQYKGVGFPMARKKLTKVAKAEHNMGFSGLLSIAGSGDFLNSLCEDLLDRHRIILDALGFAIDK